MLKVICLMGPTASGKTAISLALAEKLPIEIISVDSAMVYRTMDIGTAKPAFDERQKVLHHLIDILDPVDSYSAAEFAHDAAKIIETIIAKGKIPVLVGGTMLYFKALQQGLSLLPPANPEIRKHLLEEANKIGWQAMHERLAQVDPLAASRIHANDPQRIQRALEVWELTQEPLSDLWMKKKKKVTPYHFLNLALIPEDRILLHARIENRFNTMIKQGLIEEVLSLFHRSDLHANLPSIRSVGYRQVWMHLEGTYDYTEMLSRGIAATRQLAKRQLTWLRNDKTIQSFSSENSKTLFLIERLCYSCLE